MFILFLDGTWLEHDQCIGFFSGKKFAFSQPEKYDFEHTKNFHEKNGLVLRISIRGSSK
jgi:hypothetical protein